MSRHLPPLANLVLQTTEEIILFMRVHRVYILIKLSMSLLFPIFVDLNYFELARYK